MKLGLAACTFVTSVIASSARLSAQEGQDPEQAPPVAPASEVPA